MLRLIVMLLLFQLTPIGGEAADAVLSMISPSADRSPGDDGCDPEHGCSVLEHHCCCQSTLGTTERISPDIIALHPMHGAEFTLTSPQRAPDPQSLLRPPAA